MKPAMREKPLKRRGVAPILLSVTAAGIVAAALLAGRGSTGLLRQPAAAIGSDPRAPSGPAAALRPTPAKFHKADPVC